MPDRVISVPQATQIAQRIKNKFDNVNGRLHEETTEIKSTMQTAVLDRCELVEPVNRLNLDAVTDGKLLRNNGTEVDSASRFYTDYISVSEGDVVYYKYNGRLDVYRRSMTCYDANKTVLPDKGSNSYSVQNFTVPEGVSYIRITFDISDKAHITITVNETISQYVPYTPPYYSIKEDFLTAEAQAKLTALDYSKFACSLVKNHLRMTQGISEKWYYSNCATPASAYVFVGAGSEYGKRKNGYIEFPNTNTLNSGIYYTWRLYNDLLNPLLTQGGDADYGWARRIVTESLSDCSLLAIGDSTVDQDTMTQAILDHFTAQEHTITLIGTLGSGLNKNEGRAGWKAQDYLTGKQYGSVVNPFYDSNTQTFDFSYYMTNTGFSKPDFVLIQLGINDLYNALDSAIEVTWAAIKTMIDSILDYDNTIKILLNLPTPPNTDQSKLTTPRVLYSNAIIRYAQYAMEQAASLYGFSKVRPTYCHLILDPETDIRDDVHPTAEGYGKMALEVVNQINVWQNNL